VSDTGVSALRLVSAPARPGRPASFWRFEGAPPPGAGRTPVLALAGLGLDGRVFRGLAPLAAERDLVLANLPNEVPPGPALEPFVRGALDALDAAGHAGRPAVLAGSSFGGMVALAAALAAPERTAALVLLGTGPGWRFVHARLRAGSRFHPLVPRRAYPRVFATVMLPPGRWADPTARGDLRAQMLHRTKEFIGACVAGMRAFEGGERLGEVRAPALIVHGDQDAVFSRAAADALAARLPRRAVRIVEDCGHLPHVSRPDETVDAIRTFLGREGL
jgi:pimeloyl-ACP methyl ester carboxylesterase